LSYDNTNANLKKRNTVTFTHETLEKMVVPKHDGQKVVGITSEDINFKQDMTDEIRRH
jgi:hypothetical protein